MSETLEQSAKRAWIEVATLREQVEKLTKERDIKEHCIVQLEAEDLRAKEQLAALAEQNAKMREALEVVHAQLVDGKIFTQQVHRRPYWRYSVSEALSLPDLVTPVLNRILAEGMRMAAEICYRAGLDAWFECADAIKTDAAEMEKTNG